MDKKVKTIAEMIGEYKYGSWRQMPLQNQIVAENLAKKIKAALYSDPPSPEAPERLGFNHIPTDDELDLITTVNGTLQEEYRRQALKTYNATLKLLQQAGWGNLKEAQKHIELLESENYAYQDKESELQVRIKELEKQNEQLRIGELVITTEQKQKEQIKAEARQQALKEVENIVNPYKADQSVNLPEYCTAVGFNKAINAVKKILKRGELPEK